jgi:hypothetical protein
VPLAHHADVGLDWVGTVATAVVGVAGIGAAVWSSTRERSAQHWRARREERRRLYANLFACGDRVVVAARRVQALHGSGNQSEQADNAAYELEDVRLAFNTAVYELALSAPSPIVELAGQLREVLRQKAKAAQSGASEGDVSARHVRGQLLEAMRADLGYTDDLERRSTRTGRIRRLIAARRMRLLRKTS